MNIDDFFERINKILESPKFSGSNFPLYRGHSKADYELKPTLIRDYRKTGSGIWKLENNLYYHFSSLVGPRVKFENSWQTVFEMRHQGIPTRLLDWTENIGTALFFALDSNELDKPHIWILNPYSLNNESIGEHTLISPEVDLVEYHKTYAAKALNNSIVIHDLPFAIYPNRTNDRIMAQLGLFTIHGLNEQKMELTCSNSLEKIEIPQALIEKLKKLIKQFGINKYSVYPDFKGLTDYLKDYYKY